MPEYFDISFILEKGGASKPEVYKFLQRNFRITGQSNEQFFLKVPFTESETIVSYYLHENVNYEELCISFSKVKFFEQTFQSEIHRILEFVKTFFYNIDSLIFVVCSYELNSYLLKDLKDINDVDNDFLRKFPIAFLKSKTSDVIDISVHLNAQELF